MRYRGGLKIKKDRIRLNEEIRASEVRVIGANGEQAGIMPPQKALEMETGTQVKQLIHDEFKQMNFESYLTI